MKKTLYTIMALASLAFGLQGCEDVPMPYDYPGTGTPTDTTTTTEAVATGSGTLDDPYNCVAANQFASSLESGAESDIIYIKGKVASIKEAFTTQYGNGSFYISDDGTSTNQFYVYHCLYLGNVKYTSGDQPNVGDEVIVCGKVTNYKGNTPETVQNACYLYSLNGKTASTPDTPTGGEAKGSGTLADPYNSVAANKIASALTADQKSAEVYIKGKVVSIKEQYGTQYGNAAFYISDDGTTTDQLYVFRALYLGNVKYTAGDFIKEGDEVVICGKLMNYMGNTPETVQGEAYLYSLNGKTESSGVTPTPTPDPTPSGEGLTVKATDFGLANGTAVGTQTLSDGTTLTFDGGDNQNSPKYYNTGTNIRMYPKNSVKITAKKKIASVTFSCDTYQDVICNASGDVSSTPGTVKVDGATISVSGINSTEVTVTNTSSTTGTASQIRWITLNIVYAD